MTSYLSDYIIEAKLDINDMYYSSKRKTYTINKQTSLYQQKVTDLPTKIQCKSSKYLISWYLKHVYPVMYEDKIGFHSNYKINYA